MENSMNKEMIFAKTLEQVRKLAKEQGNCVSEEQVREAFSELELEEGQLEMVFDYLTKHKVGIGEPANLDDFLCDEDKDYLQNYLDELEVIPSYQEGEVLAHTISAMAGDVTAQKLLVEIHLKDVVEIAKLYAGQGVFLEDLIGEGNLALAFGTSMLGSIENPKEAEGMLAKMIMDAMEEYIADNVSNEKIDQKIVDKVNKVSEKARELSEDLQRKVTVEELSQETGMSEKFILDAVRMSGFQIEEIVDEIRRN